MEFTGVPVDIAQWRAAPFALDGETVFAVGDVHGCADELAAVLAAVALAATAAPGPTRLVYLGDLIDRGPRNLEVLRLWSEDESRRGVGRIDRVMGNHEQMMLLAVGDGPHAAKARAMWLGERMGGTKVLDEMRARVGDPAAALDAALLDAALGAGVVARLRAMRSHVRIGNTVFVHGGLDPGADQAE
ncbi:MAG: metallophosphoesterase, partial [Rhodospirillales bacterium]|nr:metallophosphoesterase [Rhodospirillales bacterium]